MFIKYERGVATMFAQDTKTRITNKLRQKIRENNRKDIKIRNLYVYPMQHSYGEAYLNRPEALSITEDMTRIFEQISMYSKITNALHLKDEASHTQANKITTITRILTPEFHFYSRKPLDLATFRLLVEQIEILGRQGNDNVHLFLSSFSVVTDNQLLLNLSLYVECGENTKITVVSKKVTLPSDIYFDQYQTPQNRVICRNLIYAENVKANLQIEDLKNTPLTIPFFVLTASFEVYYVNKPTNCIIPLNFDKESKLFRQLQSLPYNPALLWPFDELNALIAPCNPETTPSFFFENDKHPISNNGLFVITPKGGPPYLQGIEICAENGLKHLQKLMKTILSTENDRLIIPERVDHIVASNFTYFEESARITRFDCQLLITTINPRTSPFGVFPIRSKGYVLFGEEFYFLDIRQEFGMQLSISPEVLKQFIALSSFKDLPPEKPIDAQEWDLRLIRGYVLHNQHGFTHIDARWLERYTFPEDIDIQGLLPTLKAQVIDNTWIIENPPFGSSLRIVSPPPVILAGFTEKLQEQVQVHNEAVINKQVEELMQAQKEWPESSSYRPR